MRRVSLPAGGSILELGEVNLGFREVKQALRILPPAAASYRIPIVGKLLDQAFTLMCQLINATKRLATDHFALGTPYSTLVAGVG